MKNQIFTLDDVTVMYSSTATTRVIPASDANSFSVVPHLNSSVDIKNEILLQQG